MPTTRRRRAHNRRMQFSERALQAFRRMQELSGQCTCPEIDWEGEYWKRPDPCAACDQYYEAREVVHEELGLHPHQWLEDPEATSPYPAGCVADQHWQKERELMREMFALWRALEAAAWA